MKKTIAQILAEQPKERWMQRAWNDLESVRYCPLGWLFYQTSGLNLSSEEITDLGEGAIGQYLGMTRGEWVGIVAANEYNNEAFEGARSKIDAYLQDTGIGERLVEVRV